MKFQLEQSDESLTTHSGLALVGLLLLKTNMKKRLNQITTPEITQPQISNGDIATSYIGLLCQGKSDYDHIEEFREDPFFRQSLSLKRVPSSPTLRQRLDGANNLWKKVILEESARLISSVNVAITPCIRNIVPLDIDVSPFDNSNTKKEGVSRTYKNVDGYAPIFAYLGEEGYSVNLELREGKEHCQNGTPKFLAQSIAYARKITDAPLLIRMDSGNDSIDNIKICKSNHADFIIKRNLRKESKEDWLTLAEKYGICCEERPGKEIYMGETYIDRGLDNPIRVVFKVTKRTIDSTGQILLFPDIEVDTYWTSLADPPSKVVKLYQAHGTCEQFHSEIKSELDLERLPSGKFATNDLILHFGLMAYNILRIIGQESLKKADAPLRKKAQRRRIRTVIKNLITIASRLVYHARRYKLRFGRHCSWFQTFKRLYIAFNTS